MCAPSTSASVIMTILPYLRFLIILVFSSKEQSSPTPHPKAVIRVEISDDERTLWSCALSVFNILPLSGSMACVFLSLACLAEPAAESPSTIKSSHLVGSFLGNQQACQVDCQYSMDLCA